jgi:hypothetical protein
MGESTPIEQEYDEFNESTETIDTNNQSPSVNNELTNPITVDDIIRQWTDDINQANTAQPTPALVTTSDSDSNDTPSTSSDDSEEDIPTMNDTTKYRFTPQNVPSIIIPKAPSKPNSDSNSHFVTPESSSDSDIDISPTRTPLHPESALQWNSNDQLQTKVGGYTYQSVDIPAPRDISGPPANTTRRPKAMSAVYTPNNHSPDILPHEYVHEEDIPTTWNQMLKSPNTMKWIAAILSELKSHDDNCTFDEVLKIKDGYVALGTKWVFSLKRDINGKPIKFKARLVLQGYKQQKGLEHKFAPVASINAIRTLFTIAALMDFEIHSMDVDTAYLNADFLSTLFLKLPKGYVCKDPATSALLLRKALYGAKQNGRAWYLCLTIFLLKSGYTQLVSDPCILLTKVTPNGHEIFIGIFVDDILITGTKAVINDFKSIISSRFKMKDLGETTKYVGLELHRNRKNHSFFLTQTVYLQTQLTRLGLDHLTPRNTPADVGRDLSTRFLDPPNSNETEYTNSFNYKSKIGVLLYLANNTRPDILAALNPLCSFVTSPRRIHCEGITRIFQYLKGTSNFGLVLGGSDPSFSLILQTYTDSDWAAALDTRRSRTGSLLQLNGSTIGFHTNLQNIIAQSSTEAELMAMNEGARDLMWGRQFLHELDLTQTKPSTKFQDNQGSIALVENDMITHRTRHMDIKYLWLRDPIKNGEISTQ